MKNRDLSHRHEPVSRLFSQPQSAREWRRFRLGEEQLDFYRENGYLAGIRLLEDHQVDALRKEVTRVMDPDCEGHSLFHEFHLNESADPSRTLFHALGAWRLSPAFHDLLWNPAFLMPAFQLLEGPVRFWHDQLFCKPARHGGVVAWHQDYSYWTRTTPMAHLTCWIGLDDSTKENGCLRYVPGSHLWELLPITGLAGDMDAITQVLDQEQRKLFQPVPIELKKGECSFHHPLMVHGSLENDSDSPRRGTVINVVRDGVRSEVDQPLLQGIPAVKKGGTLEGRFFPLLFQGPTR